jgi:cyclopropane-fatty-acyl-phospholipid synthase
MPQKNIKLIKDLLALADVKINGNRPWDIQVNNPKVYSRILAGGSLALGESYMDGWWDCKALDKFYFKILSIDLEKIVVDKKALILNVLKAKIFNLQNKKRAKKVGEQHYDIGNDLYKLMLDKRMVYTCGYWKNAKTLDKAQEDKLDLVCRKIGLKKGMKVLDIGCGWGSFAKYAAKKYGVKVVGVTISKEQVKLARKNCKGLPVEIRLQDYRDVKDKFDRIISLGMFEHVGYKNYRTYMEVAHRCLKDDGLFLLHTFGKSQTCYKTDPWFDKYIFPGGLIPSITQVGKSIEKLFVMEDWHNFGFDYSLTLKEWHNNFEKNWEKIKKTGNYDERFYRMWRHYLLCLVGSFGARKIQLWQIVFSKKGVVGGYKSIR